MGPTTGRVVGVGGDGVGGIGVGRMRQATAEEPADGTFSTGGSGEATFVRAVWDPDRTPVGPSTGPRAAAFWEWADAQFDFGIGPLVAAEPRR